MIRGLGLRMTSKPMLGQANVVSWQPRNPEVVVTQARRTLGNEVPKFQVKLVSLMLLDKNNHNRWFAHFIPFKSISYTFNIRYTKNTAVILMSYMWASLSGSKSADFMFNRFYNTGPSVLQLRQCKSCIVFFSKIHLYRTHVRSELF